MTLLTRPAPISLPTGLTGLTADSRSVEHGMLFAALPGATVDGRDFIEQAIAGGATHILAPSGTLLPETVAGSVTLLTADNPRLVFSLLAAEYYGAQPQRIAAVTGTNGKTSTVQFLRRIWEKLGYRAAAVGTLGVTGPDFEEYGSLTTPDPVALHATLADLTGRGVDHLAMEASSHGLDQFRLDGVRVQVAGFSNLSRDHLDYHKTMESYLEAKVGLFTRVLSPDGIAVVNADGPHSAALIESVQRAGRRVLTCGRAGDLVRTISVDPTPLGLDLALRIDGRHYDAHVPVAGLYQAENAVLASALAIADGAAPDRVVETLSDLAGVRGRVELAGIRANGASVYIDYAHTPDALATVLTALRPHARNRLHVVFGAGGDRDPGKRPLMGEAAKAGADHLIVTDDNPRSEDPASIRRRILAACPNASEIGDRRDAIRAAVAGLAEGDVLVIAGKGHEPGQIVGDRVLPFDDREEAQTAIRQADGEDAA